jgi:hypothetical protein
MKHHALVVRAVIGMMLAAQLVSGVRRFFLFSDVNYDPYFGTDLAEPCSANRLSDWGNTGCSSPAFLVSSFSSDMLAGAPQYAISCGDSIANSGLNETESLLAYDFVANWTRLSTLYSSMPQPTIIAALGERDINSAVISEQNNSAYLGSIADSLHNRTFLSAASTALFKRCGYYSVTQVRFLRIIVLNTELWAVGARDTDEDPCGQLKFLSEELDIVRNTDGFCIIVGHKPPGIAPVSDGEEVTPNTMRYWSDRFQLWYQQIIFTNRDIITFQLFGHSGYFSFIADVNLGVPVFVIPAVSHLYGSNPSYLLASFDESTWRLQSLQQRYFDPLKRIWRDGIVVEEMLEIGTSIGKIDALASAGAQLGRNERMWRSFQTVRGGGIPSLAPLCGEGCRMITACATTFINVRDIADCVPKTALNVALKIIVTVLMCFGGMFILMTFGLVVMRRDIIFF